MAIIDEIAVAHPLISTPCPSTRRRTTALHFDKVRHVVGRGFSTILRFLLQVGLSAEIGLLNGAESWIKSQE
jgi:hypothetical protein